MASSHRVRSRIWLPSIAATIMVMAGALCFADGSSSAPELRLSQAPRNLDRTVAELWHEMLHRSAYLAANEGLVLRSLPEVSAPANDREAVVDRRFLAQLRAIPIETLSAQERLTQRVLAWYLDKSLDGRRYYWLEFVITPYHSFEYDSPVADLAAAYQLKTTADRAGYLSLLDAYARQLDQRLVKTQRQSELGIRIPRPAIDGVATTFRELAASGLDRLRVDARRLGGVEPSRAAAFNRAVESRLHGRIRPALERIEQYVSSADYRASAPQTVGLAQYPGGRDYYRYLVKWHTTLELTPDEIFEYGWRRMDELHAEMAAVRAQMGFAGTHEQFVASLAADPSAHVASAAALEAKYLGYVDRVRPLLPRYFARLPRAPFAVRRLDPAAEAGMTFGFYAAPTADNPKGEYRFNATDLTNKTTLGIGPLIYHELMPGHHMQVALSLENDSLPLIRRKGLEFTAYSEGWADYASSLAAEMGLLSDPLDRYGRLCDEAFTVARLVLDVGLNDRDWTLERARRYFEGSTLVSQAQIGTELLRYSTDLPGQALGYRIGERWFYDTRNRMQRELGPRFDIREFHSLVLDGGEMPLSVLAAQVDEYLARARPTQ